MEARRPPRNRRPTQEEWNILKTRNIFCNLLQFIMRKSRLLPFLIPEHNNSNVFRTLYQHIWHFIFKVFKKFSYASFILSTAKPLFLSLNNIEMTVLISFFKGSLKTIIPCAREVWNLPFSLPSVIGHFAKWKEILVHPCTFASLRSVTSSVEF